MNGSVGHGRFRPQQRLRRPAEFRRVFDQRLSVADSTLVVYGWPNEGMVGRLGLSVSKKIGNAVVRNRWKRRIREAFRLQQAGFVGWDVIVIPRRGAECNAHQIASSLKRLQHRLQRKQEQRRK